MISSIMGTSRFFGTNPAPMPTTINFKHVARYGSCILVPNCFNLHNRWLTHPGSCVESARGQRSRNFRRVRQPPLEPAMKVPIFNCKLGNCKSTWSPKNKTLTVIRDYNIPPSSPSGTSRFQWSFLQIPHRNRQYPPEWVHFWVCILSIISRSHRKSEDKSLLSL